MLFHVLLPVRSLSLLLCIFLSLAWSTAWFCIHFSQQDTIFPRFESFFFRFKNWIFLLCISSVTFLFSLWTNELLVTFWSVSSMPFSINITISFQKLIKILSLVPFLCVRINTFCWFSDNTKSISIAFFRETFAFDGVEFVAINIKLILLLVIFDAEFRVTFFQSRENKYSNI